MLVFARSKTLFRLFLSVGGVDVMTATLSRSDGSIGTNVSSQLTPGGETGESHVRDTKGTSRCHRANERALVCTCKIGGRVGEQAGSGALSADLTSVCQEWISQQMQQYVEDSNHVMADVQKFIHTGARLMQNGRADAS